MQVKISTIVDLTLLTRLLLCFSANKNFYYFYPLLVFAKIERARGCVERRESAVASPTT